MEEMDMNATVEKVEDIQKNMQYSVMRTPALVVDEKVVLSGKLPSLEIVSVLIEKGVSLGTVPRLYDVCYWTLITGNYYPQKSIKMATNSRFYWHSCLGYCTSRICFQCTPMNYSSDLKYFLVLVNTTSFTTFA